MTVDAETRIKEYRACAVDDCPDRAESKGWCNRHYQKWLRWGDPLGSAPSREERFWARVDKNGPIPAHRPDLGPCWIWTGGAHSEGYGSDSGRLAHRTSYELSVGPVADGLHLDHLCRVRLCVNPAHLDPVTCAENIRRGESPNAQTIREGKCRRGHALTGANLYIVPKTGGRRCRACVAFRREERKKAAA